MATLGDLDDIRDGLAKNLVTIPGLRARPYEPDKPNPPEAFVANVTVDYDQSMQRGTDVYVATVLLVVGNISDRSANKNLAAYMGKTGSSSVKTAIETDKTLDGAAKTLRVVRMDGFRPVELFDGLRYLGTEWSVQVWA